MVREIKRQRLTAVSEVTVKISSWGHSVMTQKRVIGMEGWRGSKEIQNIIKKETTKKGYWTDKDDAHFWGAVKMTISLLLLQLRGRVYLPPLNLGWLYDSLWLTVCDSRASASRGFALSISTFLAPCCLVNNPRLASLRKRGNLILRKAGQTTPAEAPSCEWGHLGLPSGTPQAWQQKNYPIEPNSNCQL